jgi:tape measure domain-containing protein
MNASATFSLAVVLSAINRTNPAFSALNSSIGRLRGAFSGTSLAAQELLTVGNMMSVTLARSFMKLGMEVEDVEMNYATLLKGNTQGAKRLVNDITDFGAATKIGADNMLENGQSLLAFGVAQDKVLPVMKQIGDLAMGNATEFNSIADNYGKMVSAQHVGIIDLRQFSLAGAPVIEELQKITGKTGEEFDKMVSAGKISVAMVEQAFANMTGEGGRFYKALDSAGATTSGRLAVATASAKKSITELSVALLPLATSGINHIIPVVDAVGRFAHEHQFLAKSVAVLGLGLVGLNVAQKGLALGTAIIKDTYSLLFKSMYNIYRLGRLMHTAQQLGNMRAYYAAMQRGGIVGTMIGRALQFARVQQLGFNAATLANPYVLGAVAIAAAVAGIGYLIYKNKELSAAEKMRISVQEKALETAASEKAGLRQLVDEMKRMKKGSDEWNEAVQKINSNYGQHLHGMDAAKIGLSDLDRLYKTVSGSIGEMARSAARAELLKEQYFAVEKEKMQGDIAMSKGMNWADKWQAQDPMGLGASAGYFFGNMEDAKKHYRKAGEAQEAIQTLRKLDSETQNKQTKIRKEEVGENGNIVINTYLDGQKINTEYTNRKRAAERTNYDQNHTE